MTTSSKIQEGWRRGLVGFTAIFVGTAIMIGSFTPLLHVWQWVDQRYLHWPFSFNARAVPGYLLAEQLFGALFWCTGLFMIAIGICEVVASWRRRSPVPD